MAVFTVALTQTCSGTDAGKNMDEVAELVRRAAGEGAELVCTPETVSRMARNPSELFETLVPEDEDAALAAMRTLAKEEGVWLLAGSLSVRVSDTHAVNRSFLLDPSGNIHARYDKIHLFDVTLPDGESHRESETYRAGGEIVAAQTPWGVMGMSVCYDLRFPGLYRELARRGAAFLTIPSAFTYQTGSAHWHILARARAIENGCFVFAPCQAGHHENGRHTYGHSLVVDPWGRILAEGGEGGGEVVTARIDTDEVAKARGYIPVLQHERELGEEPVL
ncbi:MAG: carbon-nitrogen hydrolase family protein [Hyphomicrobiales bacterium]|nr:carbon-nitrogen hydrolase family protein [Hyphomicrobiales bacterium]MCY4038952.1 carbon-nitrogen hydrolase family protein [Hyphomicrobiales bacterium]